MSVLKILGIESSCDDSGAAVVTSQHEILSNIVISQNKQHEAFCGVVPEIAARAHMQNLQHAVQEALNQAQVNLKQIDAIAATSGPGLIGGVIVGCMIGKALSSALSKPFIAINHLEGHALTARLSHKVAFPYLLLLVSGGHCQFVAVEQVGKYKILGSTLDDAAGEAFDKVAKMLNLGFPGGPIIEKLAKSGDPYKYDLPRPLIGKQGCDMSFSGLKTAVRLLIEELGIARHYPDAQNTENFGQEAADIAASFQQAVADVLASKLKAAIKLYGDYISMGKELATKTLVIAGGVAANQYLLSHLSQTAEQLEFKLIAPPVHLCTDNAAMIAWAGLERFKLGLTNDISFSPRARWSLEDIA